MDLPGLVFRSGKVVEAEILRKYGTSVCVHPSFSSKGFFLVVSFGRCKYRLSVNSVASILQATIGGDARLFDVRVLGDRVFRFSVSTQNVGFHVYKLRSFECSSYKLYFNLWHGGGPNFLHEFKQWCAEDAASWTLISRNVANSPS